MTTTLVTGGIRSGKSRHAEALLNAHSHVLYLASGPVIDPSADWRERVESHRARRPATWRTVETSDVASVLATADGPVLWDCVGTWLTAIIDRDALWDAPRQAKDLVRTERDAVIAALSPARHDVVVVTNEVGFSLVATTPVGRLFQDALGDVNRSLAEAADRVHLVVAGRVLDLSHAPSTG